MKLESGLDVFRKGEGFYRHRRGLGYYIFAIGARLGGVAAQILVSIQRRWQLNQIILAICLDRPSQLALFLGQLLSR